jgi:hypothetical protein
MFFEGIGKRVGPYLLIPRRGRQSQLRDASHGRAAGVRFRVLGLEPGLIQLPCPTPAEEELQMLFFSETLAIVSDSGEPQGELTIEVQTGKYKDELGIMSHCLIVHAFSRGFLDKTLSGNSLLGRVPAACCPLPVTVFLSPPPCPALPLPRSLLRT